MKRIQRICSLVLLAALWGGIPALHAQSFDKLWKQVEQAEKQSLPQTVIKLADEIYRKGKAERNIPQMLKADAYRRMSRNTLTPDSFHVNLQGLEQWAASEQDAIGRAVLHSLLAGSYADYAGNNRWELRKRTPLSAEEGTWPEDTREWSGNIFVRRVVQHAGEALKDTAGLLRTSSSSYVPFVLLEDGSKYYHHDMYHLLASRCIEALQRVADFDDGTLADSKIAFIYEQMINSYRRMPDREDAVLLTMLDYAKWRYLQGKAYPLPRARQMKTEELTDPYLSLLDSIISDYGVREACAEVYLAKADFHSSQGRKPEALKLCDEAIGRYPGYKRISALRNMRQSILQPQLILEVDKVAYPGDSLPFQVQHKNLEGFTLNLFRTTLAESPVDMPDINAAFYKKYARKVRTEHFSLARPEDYRAASCKCRIALPDQPGNYILQLVPDDKRGKSTDCFITLTRFKVMSISLSEEEKEFLVLDSKTGHPIADAQVCFYSTENRKNNKEIERKTTDAQGKIISKWKKNDFLLAVRKGNDTAMPPRHMYTGSYRGWGEHWDKATSQLVLLTSRSVYRPGQAVHVKGILYARKSDTADVVPNALAEVVLFDANRREISRKELRTNEFGSFATEFMLPSACLNGRYTIEATGAEGRGWTNIQVEEYKRPTFDVVFDAQKASYQVGDSVQVKGKASSFSGVPLQGLELDYTVARDVYSWWWGCEEGGTPLVSGKVLIGEDGSFTIPVRLERNADKDDDEVYYTYRITASVTNHAGETQAASTVLAAGNRSVVLSIDEKDGICKDDTIRLTFHARNLNGEPVALKGNYRLMQVAGKDSLLRASGTFESNVSTPLSEWEKLPSGEYVLRLLATDDQGRKVDYETDFKLFSYCDNRPVGHSDVWCYVLNDEFDAAHPAQFSLGTSFDDVYGMLDIFSGKQRLESKVLRLSDSITRFDIPYQEAYGAGIEYLFTFVKDGRMYSKEVKLKKRLPDKELAMKWEVFRDKLRPGQDEEWRLTIKTPQGTPAMAEMLATMYDASLDKIYPDHKKLSVNYPVFLFGNSWRDSYVGRWYNSCVFPLKSLKVPMLAYDDFYAPMFLRGSAVEEYKTAARVALTGSVAGIQSRAMAMDSNEMAFKEDALVTEQMEYAEDGGGDDASAVELRTDFSETAFFYPQLRTNEQGEISFSFTMPQSLTRWNFRGYAHTKGMLTGMLDASVVTSKEFMLSPNMPRFVRVGDKTSIAAMITNLTGNPLKGTAKFVLFDPTTEKVVSTQKQPFAVEAGKSVPVTFRFTATDKYNLLGVRIIADGGTFSDGEQHLLPVLSDKEYITETLAMPIRGEETRTFRLDSLFNRNSRTATDRRLTVEFTGNPAWYAVQALPVLSQPHTDNATAWAAAYYANTLAAHIANSQPRIKAVFDSWRMQDGRKETFLSQLQKNQDVKNILLEESPWLLEATTEAEQQARIATLFDLNNLSNGNITALTKLKELQGADGAWSWYKGMSGSRSMTGYITELLVRLPLLTRNKSTAEALGIQQKAFSYLHQQALEEYKNIRKAEKNGAKITGLSYPALHYLYLLAIADEKVPAANEAAYRYFLSMVGSNLNSKSMGIKAQSAVVLQKTGRASEANQFIASIKEHLVQTDERGAYFAFNETPFLWGSQPISVHVDVMEALHRAGGNDALVEEMKLWLLKQKQATSWDSPVATADAIYALLCQGSDLLASRGDVRITLGGKVMETYAPAQSTVSGLGYIKESFAQGTPEVRAKSVSVEKRDAGIAWGAVYAQYLSPISDVNRQGGELAVEKKLYVERTLSGGKTELQPVTASTRLKVGDKVVSRLTIRLDRAMDFVQLKDQRGACFEPMGALSGYRWANGVGYYVEVKDVSTNFFFDGLGKGVYVLEYSYRVARSGRYETGLATIQCAYAPEYAAHSASVKVDVE